MSARPFVAVLTPDPARPEYADRWRPAFAGQARLFAAAGARVEPRPWTAGPHPDADVHAATLAWGYHFDADRWLGMLDAWPAGRPLANPPAMMRWNTRKTYLAELERAGVAVVPTLFAERGDTSALARARARFGEAAELVLKPQTSAGAHHTRRVAPGEAAELDAPCMIQPFLPAVAGEGELSVFAFDGLPAHAVAKVAAPGDFRIHPQFGGRFRSLDAPADALALARAALAAAPAPAAYARVDMVRDGEGVLRLMELEVIEPDLYLDHLTDGGAAFVRAVLARL